MDLKRAYQLSGLSSRPPHQVNFPLWAWFYAHGEKKPKPDLRRKGHLEKGEKGVRLEIEISHEKILLSNFDGWHAVLNDHFFSLSDEEYDDYESLENLYSPEEILRKKEESWLRIFDLNLIPDASYEIQAVFWKLDLSMVKKVDYFTAK